MSKTSQILPEFLGCKLLYGVWGKINGKIPVPEPPLSRPIWAAQFRPCGQSNHLFHSSP